MKSPITKTRIKIIEHQKIPITKTTVKFNELHKLKAEIPDSLFIIKLK